MKNKTKLPLVSIIIRSKNEEKWIKHCIETILLQTYKKFEIIIVDNESTDNTLNIVKRFKNIQILTIKDFLPGLAINLGIKKSKGDFIVCLSAHCIPKDNNWLSILVKCLLENTNAAGVYGRQIPLSYTEPQDKRDLMIIFGNDKRIQIKDYFFHNANSIFRRNVWEKYNFDEKLTNIEDRVWGKIVIENGYNIIYEPLAEVFHYHGLHQSNNKKRLNGVISIIEKVEKKYTFLIPESFKPGNYNISAILPVDINFDTKSKLYNSFKVLINDLVKSNYIKTIYIVSNQKINIKHEKLIFIERKKIKNSLELSLDDLLYYSLLEIEKTKNYPDALLYINYKYKYRPKNIFNNLIENFTYDGCDTFFPALEDYGYYWNKDENDDFYLSEKILNNKINRTPSYKALYGIGTVISTHIIRQKKMISGKIGIKVLTDDKYSTKFTNYV